MQLKSILMPFESNERFFLNTGSYE